MSEFKVGDVVHWMQIEYLEGTLDDLNIIDPNEMELNTDILREGINTRMSFYKTKQDCIDAFKRRLDDL